MSERSELRRRREERMENGVKNLKEARLFPKTFSNHRFGDASFSYFSFHEFPSNYSMINEHSFLYFLDQNKRSSSSN